MSSYGLYLCFKQLLEECGCPSTVDKTYNNMELSKENKCGIYVRNWILPNERSLGTGEYMRDMKTVQLLLNSGSDKESMLQYENLMDNIHRKLPTIFNRSFELDKNKIGWDESGNIVYDKKSIVNGLRINFIRLTPLTGVINLGRAPQGFTRYSCQYMVEFCIDSYEIKLT